MTCFSLIATFVWIAKLVWSLEGAIEVENDSVTSPVYRAYPSHGDAGFLVPTYKSEGYIFYVFLYWFPM